MPESYIIASDLGTGGCKTLLVDHNARVIATANYEYKTSYPRPGWHEQDPGDWLKAVGCTVREVLAKTQISPSQIAAYGLVGVTHNAVILDASGEPLRPCIIFYDTRSQPESEELNHRWGEKIFQQTCNSMSPVWTWPQLLWVKRNEPQVWSAAHTLLFQKDYVRNYLAPSMVSDLIDVEGCLLYNPRENGWIPEFIEDLGIPMSALPQVVKPADVISQIDQRGRELTGLLVGTPVIAGTTDTVAEVLGAGALCIGQGTVKLASVGRITCVSEEPALHPNLLNYRHVINGLWYPGTATKFATSAFRWLREMIWHDCSYAEMDIAAATIPPGSEGLIFHPHLNGEWAPYWDGDLRGNFLGLTVRHGRAHMARAVMEGVSFALRAGVEYARNFGLPFDDIRLIGGGSGSSLWAQTIADTLNRRILIPVQKDAAFGAALLVGMGTGMFPKHADGIQELIRFEKSLEPDPARVAIYQQLYEIYQSTDALLQTASHQLSAFDKTNFNFNEKEKSSQYE